MKKMITSAPILNKKKILIAVSGGIAAYKTAELIRLLRTAQVEIQVVMTESAQKFITALSLQALANGQVHVDLFDQTFENSMAHIHLARWADVIVIAPASADLIARLAHGLANDLLTTVCLATTAPVFIVPAMNKQMWENRLTQSNAKKLKKLGYQIIGPDTGSQACGEFGLGRMIEPLEIFAHLENFFNPHPFFLGKKVLITAGPTHEFIDPIRFISTSSTGLMGYCLAEVFANTGAEVHLISGPCQLDCPRGVHRILVTSAAEMHDEAIKNLPIDIFIGAAAVADYRPEAVSPMKLKRKPDVFSLKLIKNTDILLNIQNLSPKTFIVGFAAETNQHLLHASEKLRLKNADIIVLNSIANGQGFGDTPNAVTILTKQGEILEWPVLSKKEIASRLADMIATKLQHQSVAMT